ncbi:MAG TPA: class I SAM-dependent methyltransferase [Blastocatellia bacterium]
MRKLVSRPIGMSIAESASTISQVALQAKVKCQSSAGALTDAFYRTLRDEVTTGNPFLTHDEQALLRTHYPTIMAPGCYSTELAAAIYTARRSPPCQAISGTIDPYVLDAGCAFGSESFLFASLGARVLAVDVDPGHIAIAVKRQRYYEDHFGRTLDINFEVADLNTFDPNTSDLSLTWIASVLAAIRDQNGLLRRIYDATRTEGQIMITDMNLLNPLFLSREFLRRRRAKRSAPEFAREAGFWSMLTRGGRSGARFYPRGEGAPFDDVQFFTPRTISELLRASGFRPNSLTCSGFGLPMLGRRAVTVERILPRVLALRKLGYFYLASAIK